MRQVVMTAYQNTRYDVNQETEQQKNQEIRRFAQSQLDQSRDTALDSILGAKKQINLKSVLEMAEGDTTNAGS